MTRSPHGPDYEQFPCGCIMDVQGDTFLFEPCSFDCWVYKYVLEASREVHGKEPTILDMR